MVLPDQAERGAVMAGKAGRPADARPRPARHADHTSRTRAAAKRFVDAVAATDLHGMVAALAPDVRLRYLIPPGPGEIVGAAAVAAKYLQWFGAADAIRAQSVLVEPLAERISVRYRFLLHREGHEGWEVIEQQAYLDIDDGLRITAIDLLCSGFRPTAGEEPVRSSGTHQFDAGMLGCADGLAQEFRRRILTIPIGDVLVVETSDPAAKEDLPPLARMMGHTVRSVEPSGNGRLLITVERGR
jgi:TusA-related sulfurtransferase